MDYDPILPFTAGKQISNGETPPGNHQPDDDKNSSESRSRQDQRSTPWQRPPSAEVLGLPSPADQRATAERLDAAGTYAYAVSKRWMQRWQRFVGLCPKTPSKSPLGDVVQVADDEVITLRPGSVEMDCESDDQNVFVDEGLWRRLVLWYGISPIHQLDRKNRFFEDRKPFEVCVLNSFSGIVAHVTKVLNRFEEIGFVEYQLRRVYGLNNDQLTMETRLWISEKALVPRFQLLLNRNKMLNDFLDRDKAYILALEKRDSDAQFWPTGEPGTPKGDLSKYDELLQGPRIQSTAPKEWQQNLHASLKDIVENVGRTFAEDSEKQLQRQREQLDEIEAKFKVKEGQIVERRKAVERQVKDLTRRRRELETQQEKIEIREQQLNEAKERIRIEEDFMDRILQGQNSRIVLDVGGEIFETSRATMRKDGESLLAAMFADSEGLVPEEDGSFFIDRDGSQFRFILEFLRDGTSIDNLFLEGASLRGLLREAQFYQLNQLVDHLKKLTTAGNE